MKDLNIKSVAKLCAVLLDVRIGQEAIDELSFNMARNAMDNVTMFNTIMEAVHEKMQCALPPVKD